MNCECGAAPEYLYWTDLKPPEEGEPIPLHARPLCLDCLCKVAKEPVPEGHIIRLISRSARSLLDLLRLPWISRLLFNDFTREEAPPCDLGGCQKASVAWAYMVIDRGNIRSAFHRLCSKHLGELCDAGWVIIALQDSDVKPEDMPTTAGGTYYGTLPKEVQERINQVVDTMDAIDEASTIIRGVEDDL